MLWKTSLPLLAAVIASGGCATCDVAFEPHPADVATAKPGTDAEPVHVLASILGVGGACSGETDRPATLDVRLRIENTSPYTVGFDPATLVLFSGALVRFPDPLAGAGPAVEVAPGGSATVDASFPFPGDGRPEGTDLTGLNLRWTLVIDGEPVTGSAGFVQRDEYDIPARGVGVGYQRYH